ncbi:MAG: hypothetical protein JSV23_09130 [Promethearchaeota archaeon]|nr:MAG: hypothetical protein JSV23_09130 [Candidatus Lokiarchaeota archaeon]
MPREIKGIIISRLIILISIIAVPIVIFLIYYFADFNLWYSSDDLLTLVVIKILSPSIFSISWLFFLILFINRFVTTLDNFDKTISVVPSRLKFFYGINAIYILLVFIFPLITPIISILSFASMAWRLTTFRKKAWDEDSKVSFITRFMIVLSSIIPIFCAISVLPEYFNLASFLLNDIWLPILPYLFIISYSLFTALAIGTFILLFYNAGISEYEQFLIEPSKKRTFWNIKILEIFLFAFFLFLDLGNYEVISLFYLAGFIFIIITSIINFFQGKSKIKGFKSHLIGYIIAAIFIGSNVIFSTAEISGFLRFSSLMISAVLYVFVFFYTFFQVE